MKENDFALLITGCINPSADVYALTLKNSGERRSQTIDAVSFFINGSNVKNIIYCDNSGAICEDELLKMAESRSKNFEWISFNGDVAQTEKRGKGFGEGEIINYAINHSDIISNVEYIVKVTGRVKVLNIDTIVRKMKSNKIYINLYERKRSASTLFWGMPKCTYEGFYKDCNQAVDDRNCHSLEEAFGDTTLKNGLTYAFIPSPLNLDGIAGTSGNRYNRNIFQRNKSYLRMYGERIINYFATD